MIKVPSVLLWEIAILHAKGRIKLDDPFDLWVGKFSSRTGFDIIQLENEMISLSVDTTSTTTFSIKP